MDKGKQPVEEGFQHKKKWVVSIKSDESVPGEGLMADARHACREEELFRISSGVDPTDRLVDVANRGRQLLLRLCLPVQWQNGCLNKVDWKELRQRGQGLLSHCNTMICFYQVNS